MKEMEAGSVDCVITDPPYPELKGGVKHFSKGGVAKVINDSYSVGDIWNANLDWMEQAWRICDYGLLAFCSYHSVDIIKQKLRENAIGLITWHKRNSPVPVNNVPRFTTEFIWVFKKQPGIKWRGLQTMYDIPGVPGGSFGKERIKNKDGTTAHPTQKPLKLMSHLVNLDGIESVLDPFMGSGTTGVACAQLKRKFIGIELDPDYFKIAEKRIQAAYNQGVMF